VGWASRRWVYFPSRPPRPRLGGCGWGCGGECSSDSHWQRAQSWSSSPLVEIERASAPSPFYESLLLVKWDRSGLIRCGTPDFYPSVRPGGVAPVGVPRNSKAALNCLRDGGVAAVVRPKWHASSPSCRRFRTWSPAPIGSRHRRSFKEVFRLLSSAFCLRLPCSVFRVPSSPPPAYATGAWGVFVNS
jgi:hypothetical protein